MKRIFLQTGLLILISLSAFSQMPAYAPTAGIVGFWSFNGNANDVSGNGNNGTVYGGAVLTTNRLGSGNGAYYFPSIGCASFIHANVNASSINTNKAITVSFWVYRSGNGCLNPDIIEFSDCTGACVGQLEFSWPNSQNITLNIIPIGSVYPFLNTSADNTWYHIAYTYDGTTTRYYLNGILNGTDSPNPSYQLNGDVTFGSANPASNGGLNGKLYDIGLWNRALSDCEIYALYSGDPSSSFAYNPLQDTTFICDSSVLDAGAGYNSYAWSTGDNSQTISAKNSGEYEVTVTNTSGCKASDSTYISKIKPGISQKDTSVCAGSTIALSATGISGTSQTLVDNFFINTSTPFTHTVNTIVGKNYIMAVSGIWSVHFCTDPNNVSDAAYYYQRNPITALPNNLDLVTWNGVPVRPDGNTYNPNHVYNYTLPPATQTTQTFIFTDPGTYTDNCNGLTVQIYQLQTSNATYTWSANPVATAGLNTADINKQSLSVSPTATTTYYVTVNDGITSCEDSVKITVATVDTSLTVSDPLLVCASGGSVHMQAGITNSYKWLLNGTTIPIATARNYTATQTGAYRVVVTNSTGCIDTTHSVNVTLYPQPVTLFTINNNVQCLNGNSFVFTNGSTISSGSLHYQWNFGDGQNDLSTSPTHSYSTANTFSVKLISISDNGCEDSLTQTVKVNPNPPPPVITAGGPVSFCTNGSVLLTSSASLPMGNQWYQDGIAISGANNQSYTASATGAYTSIASYNTNCTSSASNSISVTVIPTPPAPNITANGGLGICANEYLILTSDATSGNQWYKNGILINGATSQTYSTSSAATYTVIATVNTCSSVPSAGTIVTVNPITTTPTVTTNGQVSFCGNGNVVLTSSAVAGNQWYNGGVAIFGATNEIYVASSTGAYSVVTTAANSCPSNPSNPVDINITLPVQAIRYPVVNAYINTPTTLQARTFGNQYAWIPGVGLDDSTSASPIFNYNQTIDYIIRITTNGGCVTYDSVLVVAYKVKGIIVPTAFSPNGDGLNDILHLFLIDVKQLNYFKIYNKWGQLIFESNNSSKGWDGNYNGVAQPIGNYVWMGQAINNNGTVINQNGQIVLVR